MLEKVKLQVGLPQYSQNICGVDCACSKKKECCKKYKKKGVHCKKCPKL